MTEREKFELWAESQGLPFSDIAWAAWQAAKHQAHCETLVAILKGSEL